MSPLQKLVWPLECPPPSKKERLFYSRVSNRFLCYKNFVLFLCYGFVNN